MFAKSVLTGEERTMDPHLGYPRGYGKLCRHAFIQPQGLITPFTLGPPQQFLPYTPQPGEISKMKVYEDLFPIVDEGKRDFSSPERYVDILWQQMDHLGNAGFDPAKFRIDTYGNVLYRDADSGSPLSWEIDHWFPHSRGGKSVPSNLKLVQWQVNQRRREKLEFLVPWWDLQLGVSVNQFLMVFSSENNEFRQRALSLFFLDGENEQIGDKKASEIHSQPNRRFRECKNKDGFAAASIVQASKNFDNALRSLNTNTAPTKHLHMDKENKTSYFSTASAIQAEHKWRESLKEAKKERVEEVTLMEAELRNVKEQNLKEKEIIDQLERTLSKHKKRVEKQRKWSETQSQYRICLEKMIRDTLHQTTVYKQQTKLNQAACNALLARLESQKSTCDAAELELLRRIKEREDLEASIRPKITKRFRHHGNTDVGSLYIKPNSEEHLHEMQLKFKTHPPNNEGNCLTQAYDEGYESASKDEGSELSSHMEKVEIPVGSSGTKRKALEMSGELDVVLLGYEYGEERSEKGGSAHAEESVGDNESLPADRKERKWHDLESGEGSNNDDDASNNESLNDDDIEDDNEIDDDLDLEDDSKIDDDDEEEEEEEEDDDDDDDAYDEDDDNASGNKTEEENVIVKQVSNYDDGDSKKNRDESKRISEEEEEEEVNGLLEEVLEMQGKMKEAMVEAILGEEEDEGERAKKLGKLNVDKWLQNLLLDSGYGENGGGGCLASAVGGLHNKENQSRRRHSLDGRKLEEEEEEEEVVVVDNGREKDVGLEIVKRQSNGGGGGIIGGLLKKLNMKSNGSGGIQSCSSSVEDPKMKLGESRRRLSMGEVVVKKLTGGGIGGGNNGGEEIQAAEKRSGISPWRRWPSPVAAFRRSSSAGCEARRSRGRTLSPWRRNEPAPASGAAEQRKVIESFSKLKIVTAKEEEAAAASESPPAPRRQSVAFLQRAAVPEPGPGRSSSSSSVKPPPPPPPPPPPQPQAKTSERSRIHGAEPLLPNHGAEQRSRFMERSRSMVVHPAIVPRNGGGAARKDSMMMMKQPSRHAVPGPRRPGPSPPAFSHQSERRAAATTGPGPGSRVGQLHK